MPFQHIGKKLAMTVASMGTLTGLVLTAPAAEAASRTQNTTAASAAYCTQTVNPDLLGGYSYCVNITGSHRVAIYCEHIFGGRWVYGPWKPSGQESHANCGWGEYVTQIFTQ